MAEEKITWHVDVEALTLNDLVFLEELSSRKPQKWGDFRERLAAIVHVEPEEIGKVRSAELWPLVRQLIKEVNEALALPKASTTDS